MSMRKKVADFIRLEDGNVGKHAAAVTGALLTASVLGAVLTQPAWALPCCHYEHTNMPHTNSHGDSHTNYGPINEYNDGPYPCMDCQQP